MRSAFASSVSVGQAGARLARRSAFALAADAPGVACKDERVALLRAVRARGEQRQKRRRDQQR